MQEKTVIVTGATNGIGAVTALELAKMGAQVLVVSRNAQRCEKTVADINAVTGRQDARAMPADLSSLAEIRRLAQAIQAEFSHIDVLVNNAGAFFQNRRESVDGYEMTFALNHLSYFLLTQLLLEELRAAARDHGEARIVNVSSGAHFGTRKLDIDAVNDPKHFSSFGTYSETKLMNILFTYELARRLQGTGVTVNALHPGFVRTGFGMNNHIFVRATVRFMQMFAAISSEEGAQTQIYLASSPEVKGVTGRYFDKKKAVKSSQLSYDEGLQKRLWELSAQLTGLPTAETV